MLLKEMNMSNFVVEIMEVDDVLRHPEADRLAIVKVRGYNCISADLEDGTPRYRKGDLVAYIPEGALLPDTLLQHMGFWKSGAGTLAGKHGNRVKAIRLRGIVSQGILVAVERESQHLVHPHGNSRFVNIGTDVAEFLGITKYEPVVPQHMSGEVANVGLTHTLKYDIENIQKYPNVFVEGEEVVITEKLHGTFCAIGYDTRLDNSKDLYKGKFFAFSKGLGAQGLVFKNNAMNLHNVYQKVLEQYASFLEAFCPSEDELQAVHKDDPTAYIKMIFCGEIFGRGIQDLNYGLDKPEFRIFDIYMEAKRGDTFVQEFSSAADLFDGPEVENLEGEIKIPHRVPVLYRGPFSNEIVNKYRDGTTSLNGVNIREGVVVKPVTERVDPFLGRVILKAVSPDYLLRKGNTTEFN
jgi:RNA ligase (TIGR02306 family)